MNIKIESWSHSSGEWQHFDYFETKEKADIYIVINGYDPRYFRVAS